MAVADEVKEAWQQAKHRFRAVRGSTFKRLPERWADAVKEIRGVLAAHLGAEAVETRFAVPEQFVAYMQTVGGNRRREAGLGFYLASPEGVAREFRDSYEMYVTAPRNGRTPKDTGFWLWVGTWSDKHDFLLGCDRAHPLFGYVLEVHDDHPYRGGAGSGTRRNDSQSFLGFLGWLARQAVPGTSPVTDDG